MIVIPSDQNDRISLRSAIETPAWLMVYASDPERNIDVTMTYADLFAIYRWITDLQKTQKEGDNNISNQITL